MPTRPMWMTVLMLFCAYMAFIYGPWDLLMKPLATDVDVWFGIALRGWAAKLSEPLHIAIYAAGAYGFWRMRPWMWPWAAVYCAQVAIAMAVWGIVYAWPERGALVAIAGGGAGVALFGGLTVALWRARPWFRGAST